MTRPVPAHLCMWTIYHYGTDGYLGHTARLHRITSNGSVPTTEVIRTPHLERIRDVMRAAGKVCITRDYDDDPVIMESWL